jgi:TatA/E family protein of Tat protein translocase
MNVLGMGPMELLLIVVLALIVFGPAKLPEIMGQVGRAIADFRRATSSLSDEFNRTIQSELQETRALVDEAKTTITDARAAVSDVHTSVTAAVSSLPAPLRTALPPSDVVPTTNGTNGLSAQPYTSTSTNGTAQATPPLANTTKWSWEVAAPAPKIEEASPRSGEPGSTAHHETGDASPSTDAPKAAGHEHASQDDLLPPY